MSDLARIFTILKRGFAAGGSIVLLSDYDGTLVPLVADPDEAWLPRAVRDDVRLLSRAPRVQVGVISGRDLHDVHARVGLSSVIYAGCHGFDIEGPGLKFRHPKAETYRPALNALACALRRRLVSIPGAQVEAKTLSVAVHCRNMDPSSFHRLRLELDQVNDEGLGTFKTLQGSHVIEFLPPVSWNKGQSALWIRNHLAPRLPAPSLMLYMGDDETDQLAFNVLSGRAITVKVGPDQTLSAATYRLRSVTEVHRLLSALAAEFGRPRLSGFGQPGIIPILRFRTAT